MLEHIELKLKKYVNAALLDIVTLNYHMSALTIMRNLHINGAQNLDIY